MISRQVPPWQTELARAIRDPEQLLALLGLPVETLDGVPLNGFGLRVPMGFVARMRKGDPSDPLLRQVLPSSGESREAAGFCTDPVGDWAAMQTPGVIHKYQGRALLVTTGACGIHCRYCFRRHFDYGDANAARNDWRTALDYVAGDPSIWELILSGGDPLVLPDERLAKLVSRIAEIPHVRHLRIHTRLPVVLPERVDSNLLGWMHRTDLTLVVVVHANHPNELDGSVMSALRSLGGTGATLLNQSVLLAGVNDDAAILSALSEKLFTAGILPYYLHMLDRVHGAAHFEVDQMFARSLVDELRVRLPGYLVPRLVREIPGRPFKVPL